MTDTLLKRVIKIIPEDWERVKIGDIGSTYGGLTNKSKKDFGEGKPYIPFMNIMNNAKIDLDYFDYVNIQEGENQNRALEGDLFFNTSSETPEEVGMCAVLDKNILELYLNSFCFGFRLKDQDSLNPLFVSYFFRSDFGRKVMFPLAQGMTRYNLSKRYFLQLEIPKPKIEEQNKIIDILSTVDEAIEKTDAIIEETRQLKKGLIQKLFTEGIGHIRFKETKIGRIPEEWDINKLKNFGEFLRGKNINKSEITESGFPCVRYGDIYVQYEFANTVTHFSAFIGKETADNGQRIKYGDIIFAGTGETQEEIGKCVAYVRDDEAYAGGDIFLFRPNNGISFNAEFLSYCLNSGEVGRLKSRLGQGLSIFHIYPSHLQTLEVPLPTIEEQNQIVKILSEVDAKIEKEEATKAELEQLKKGLMQVLLTGKVRVKVEA